MKWRNLILVLFIITRVVMAGAGKHKWGGKSPFKPAEPPQQSTDGASKSASSEKAETTKQVPAGEMSLSSPQAAAVTSPPQTSTSSSVPSPPQTSTSSSVPSPPQTSTSSSGPSPPQTSTSSSGPSPPQPSVSFVSNFTSNDTAALNVSRTIVNHGMGKCTLDQSNQTTASIQLTDFAVSSTRAVPHPPEIATEGRAGFIVTFTSSSPNLRATLVKSWNLNEPRMVSNTSFTFVEADLGNAPGATFLFYGIDSCFNGVMTPSVSADVKAYLNGANIPLKNIN
jgi:hypothetical protein